MSTISNTTVLSNFASIDQLTVLQDLYGSLAISLEVYEEIQVGLEEGYRFYTALENQIAPMTPTGWVHLTSVSGDEELRLFSNFPLKLYQGEASSLAIAHHRDWLFLSDDLDARRMARQLGIRLSGSLGCLVLAVERRMCSLRQANVWLTQMIEQGYHSPVIELTSLL
jgi:predicted nucleic acid-binding protein